MHATGRLLIIAGSDSGGGAGLQADLKTATACGVYAMTAVSAITVQNTLGVSHVHPVPAAVVADQMRVCLSDIGADVLKTGMLGTDAVVRAVCEVIDEMAGGVPLVVDPVMVAKGGARLLDSDAMTAVKAELVRRASLITPNVPEAEALTGFAIRSPGDLPKAAELLLSLGPGAVLLKGGHLEGREVVDLLMTPAGMERFVHPRIETRHTHGTGCTLASAIASGLAQDLPLRAAVARGIGFVMQALRTAPGLGQGHGPLNHMHRVPPWT